MAHQQMFDDDDPLLERLRAFASTLPGAAEKVSHGRPAFFTTRVFAYFGGALKIGDQWIQHPQSILVKLDADERRTLLSEPRSWVPALLRKLEGKGRTGEVSESGFGKEFEHL